MYVNDVEEGGETFFPKLNFTVTPKKGMAVYFEYFYNDQTLNELTLHGGAPVKSGVLRSGLGSRKLDEFILNLEY